MNSTSDHVLANDPSTNNQTVGEIETPDLKGHDTQIQVSGRGRGSPLRKESKLRYLVVSIGYFSFVFGCFVPVEYIPSSAENLAPL